jgi:hypothetical protein
LIVHSLGSKAGGALAAVVLATGVVAAHGLALSVLHALGEQRLVPLLLAAVCAPLVPGATSAACVAHHLRLRRLQRSGAAPLSERRGELVIDQVA